MTLLDRLERRASRDADALALVWLSDGDRETARLTFAQLASESTRLARGLCARCPAGARVVLLLDSAPEFLVAFLATLQAGLIAVPAHRVHSKRDRPRMEGIVRDCTPALLLAEGEPESGPDDHLTLEQTPLITLDELRAGPMSPLDRRPATATDLAYLQYTSGSTTEPRGVKITHANLVATLALIEAEGAFDGATVAASWLPLFHDLGLVFGALQGIYSGFPTVIFPATAFALMPARWLRVISHYRVTHSGAPNFAYDLCVDKSDPATLADVRLDSWRVAFSGAEPVRPETLTRFSQTFAPIGFDARAFCPVYGLAEATLKAVTTVPGRGAAILPVVSRAFEESRVVPCAPGTAGASYLVSCGAPCDPVHVAIVDPETGHRLPDNLVGEVWVSGPMVSDGYWNREIESAETFGHLLPGDEHRYMRTGDFGFLRDGALYVTGRLKDSIIIRGRNHYPQDIERTLSEASPALRGRIAVALAVPTDGRDRLLIVQELKRTDTVDHDALAGLMRSAIARGHGLHASTIVFVTVGVIPRTTSGKLRRQACKALYLAGSLPIIAETTIPDVDVQAALLTRAELLAGDVAGQPATVAAFLQCTIAEILRVGVEQVPRDVSPGRLGLDSLAALAVAHRVQTQLELACGPEDLLEDESIDDLAGRLVRALHEERPSLRTGRVPDPPVVQVANATQRALWFLQQLEPESTAWTIARALRIEGPLAIESLRLAWRALGERHPILRHAFHEDAREIVSQLDPDVQLALEVVDCGDCPESEWRTRLADEMKRPFRLETAPLARAILYRVGPARAILLVCVHHIVFDDWSLPIMIADLEACLRRTARGVPPETPRARRVIPTPAPDADAIAAAMAYWQTRLSSALPVLWPGRADRRDTGESRAASVPFVLDREQTAGLRELAREQGVTLFTMLLALFEVLLYRHTGERQLAIGVPIHGRDDAGLRDVIGCYVRTVPIRADLRGRQTFAELLASTSAALREGMRHGIAPFETVVDRLGGITGRGRSPIFQTMLTFHAAHEGGDPGLPSLALNREGAPVQLGPYSCQTVEVPVADALYALTLTVAEDGDQLAARFELDEGYLTRGQVLSMAEHVPQLVASVLASPTAALDSLRLLTHDDVLQQVQTWNRPPQPLREMGNLADLIKTRLCTTPKAPAILFEGGSQSYGELRTRVTALSRQLRRAGAGPERAVGLCADRSPHLIAGVLAILHTDAVYVPLDPSYPDDRLHDMVTRAGVKTILCDTEQAARLARDDVRIVPLDAPGIRPTRRSAVSRPLIPSSAAYIVFTSGSTGRPKGAVNTVGALWNRITWMRDHLSVTADDVILQKTPIGFDVSLWELLLPFATGARVALAAPEGHRDPRYLRDAIRRFGVTIAHFVPSMLKAFLEQDGLEACTSLRCVVSSGEALSRELRDRFYERCPGILYNLYGPTEAAIDVTATVCPPEPAAGVTIGTPIANTTIHLLDPRQGLAPAYRPCELYIGGVAPARGYVGDPRATAERFVPDHLSPESGARRYRTGDLVRRLPDGRIEYLQRMDDQIKIRGMRVELQEVEAVLRQYPAVADCAAAVRTFPDGDPRLVAFVVWHDEAAPVQQLLDLARQALPSYMVPSLVLPLDQLPLTSSGKLSRRDLPEIDRSDILPAAPPVAPRDELERLVADIWASELRLDPVGVHENFFELGGHSMAAARIISTLAERLDVDLTVSLLFSSEPTIAGLAAAVRPLLASPDRHARSLSS